MAMLTSALVQALQTTVDKSFRKGWGDGEPFQEKIATTVPSSVRTQTYAWMQRLPAMRQWVGARVLQNMADHNYQLENLPWELTESVNEDDWEDDELGIYGPLFEDMGRAARMLSSSQVRAALELGATTGLCFDGVSMFNNAHPALGAGAAIDNNFAGTTLTAANYEAVRAAMGLWQGEDGLPLGVKPNLLVVPPALEGVGRRILNAEIVASAAGTATESNVWQNSAELLVIDQLTAAATWYLMDTRRSIKPLIWQNRRSPRLVSRANPQDSNVFNTKQLQWGVDARGAAGYGPFFLAARALT